MNRIPPRHSNRCRTARSVHAPARRGAISLLFILLMVVFALLAAWVLDWAYLVLVQRNMQHRTDLIALAAAPAILDEDQLRDALGPPVADPADDLLDSTAVAHDYRQRNNAVSPAGWALMEDDLRLTFGRVADVNDQTAADYFLPGQTPYNTLRVESLRSATGANPVARFIQGFWIGSPVDVASTSYATLDNLLIGFRPRESVNAPVVPLAIDWNAWQTERMQSANQADPTGAGVLDIEVRLTSPDPAAEALAPANAALVGFDGAIDLSLVLSQITAGVSRFDLPATQGQLGPATPTMPLAVASQRSGFSGSYNSELVDRFFQLSQAGTFGHRVFPLYSAAGQPDQVDLIGFVAARVLQASLLQNRLAIVLEPVYLVETTAWTVEPTSAPGPLPNLYIHKLRLSR